MSKAAYVGVKTNVPIYGKVTVTETFALNTANIDRFFAVTNGTGTSGWTLADNSSAGLNLAPGNFGVNSSTATVTLKAVRALSSVVITGAYYTETNYDKITLTVAGSTVLNAVSGSSASAQRYSGSIAEGDEIVLKYVKDTSNSLAGETDTLFTITCNDITVTSQVDQIVAHEQKDVARRIKKMYVGVNGVARMVKKAYVGVNGVARLFFVADVFKYSGEYSVADVTKDSVAYKLYALTSSGTLTLGVAAQVWGCGGGAGGQSATASASGGGGGGGYVLEAFNLAVGSYAVTIGAGGAASTAGGATSIAGRSANGGGIGSGTKYGGAGGSGGGASAANDYSSYDDVSTGGKGAGVSTYPFGIADLNAHCAGGGGSADEYYRYKDDDGNWNVHGSSGGAGGTDGGDGGGSKAGGWGSGTGGEYGGGRGATTGYDGKPGTFYGAGGGGGSRFHDEYNIGGAGYQGVVYVLIPAA